MYSCIPVYPCMHASAYACTCKYAHIHALIYTCTHTHINTNMDTNIYEKIRYSAYC